MLGADIRGLGDRGSSLSSDSHQFWKTTVIGQKDLHRSLPHLKTHAGESCPSNGHVVSEKVQLRCLDHVANEQRLQKLSLLDLEKGKMKDNLMATYKKGGYNGDRVKLFSVAGGDTPRGNGHRLWFGKFRFYLREKLLP